MTQLLALLLAATLAYPHAPAAPDRRQTAQVEALFGALAASRVACPASLAGAESRFFCATTARDAASFRSAIDRAAAPLKPVSPWASYTGQNDQQRSFLYRDGFVTVTYLPSRRAGENSMVIVQYAMPHD